MSDDRMLKANPGMLKANTGMLKASGQSIIKKIPGRLKWGDVVLKQIEVSPNVSSPSWNLRPGETLTADVPPDPLLLPAVQKVREAAARHQSYDLEIQADGSTASHKVQKVEALTIKQKVVESRVLFELTLRKA